MESISVVIPCYNSRGKLLELFLKISVNLKDVTHEIIFIDDGSIDSTWDEIKKISKLYPAVKGLKLSKNLGQQNAVFAGLCYTNGDLVITMDDDFQHNPSYIPVLIEQINKGYELVYAVNKKKYSIIRKAGSLLHDIFFYVSFRKPFDLKITSFRIIKRSLVKKITETEKAFIYISAIALKHNPETSFIKSETVFIDESRYSINKLIKLFINLFINYSFPDSLYNFFSRFAKRKSAKTFILDSVCETAGNIYL